MHSDGARSVGKNRVDVRDLGVELLSLTVHRSGGPNGIGALYIRNGSRLTPLLHGAGKEAGRRAGTERALRAAQQTWRAVFRLKRCGCCVTIIGGSCGRLSARAGF